MINTYSFFLFERGGLTPSDPRRLMKQPFQKPGKLFQKQGKLFFSLFSLFLKSRSRANWFRKIDNLFLFALSLGVRFVSLPWFPILAPILVPRLGSLFSLPFLVPQLPHLGSLPSLPVLVPCLGAPGLRSPSWFPALVPPLVLPVLVPFLCSLP